MQRPGDFIAGRRAGTGSVDSAGVEIDAHTEFRSARGGSQRLPQCRGALEVVRGAGDSHPGAVNEVSDRAGQWRALGQMPWQGPQRPDGGLATVGAFDREQDRHDLTGPQVGAGDEAADLGSSRRGERAECRCEGVAIVQPAGDLAGLGAGEVGAEGVECCAATGRWCRRSQDCSRGG